MTIDIKPNVLGACYLGFTVDSAGSAKLTATFVDAEGLARAGSELSHGMTAAGDDSADLFAAGLAPAFPIAGYDDDEEDDLDDEDDDLDDEDEEDEDDDLDDEDEEDEDDDLDDEDEEDDDDWEDEDEDLDEDEE